MTDELVSISMTRLKELEEMEKKLPVLIEQAVQDYKRSTLERLHLRDKENPAMVNARVRRYAQRHREKINKKLREKRQSAKQNKPCEVAPANMVVESVKRIFENGDSSVEVRF